MKYTAILFMIWVYANLTTSLMAQSEQGYILGMKNFEKSFPAENSDQEYLADIYQESYSDGNNLLKDKHHTLDINSFTFTFNHLAISVKDINRSVEFYKNVLKLTEITNRTKIEGIRWFSLGEGQEIHLISILPDKVTINKAVHLGLTSPNFDTIIEQLTEMNIVYSDWSGTPNKINMRADGIKQIFFQDPDGYWIEVNNVAQK